MRLRAVAIVAVGVAAVAAVPPITDPDDGADVREEGTVVVIGPAPAGGGWSVSAVGTGCTTRGATTKLPAASVIVDVDADELDLPEIPAGVVRIVVRNYDEADHGLVLTALASADELPVDDDGLVVEEELPGDVFRIAEFAGNTICEGTFELPAGDYVAFSPAPGDVKAGIVAELTICGDAEPAEPAESTVSTEKAEPTSVPESTAPPTSVPDPCDDRSR